MRMITESHGLSHGCLHPPSPCPPHGLHTYGGSHGSLHTHHHFRQEICYADRSYVICYLGSDDDDTEV